MLYPQLRRTTYNSILSVRGKYGEAGPVGELAKSLKPGGSIVVYGLQGGQFPAMPPKEFIYRGLSLHGFWLSNWRRNAPRTEIEEAYQKLGDLVADGSLSAAVGHV